MSPLPSSEILIRADQVLRLPSSQEGHAAVGEDENQAFFERMNRLKEQAEGDLLCWLGDNYPDINTKGATAKIRGVRKNSARFYISLTTIDDRLIEAGFDLHDDQPVLVEESISFRLVNMH